MSFSVNSPQKVGNINIFNMPRTLEKNSQHKVSQQAFEPHEDPNRVVNPELTFAAAPLGTTAMSRNQSVANILEQVINRLERIKSRDNSIN